jgi:hypothetical protein
MLGVILMEPGVELPDDEGGFRGLKGLRKTVLADSDGVIVAVVIIDWVSSSSSSTLLVVLSEIDEFCERGIVAVE